VPKIVEADLQVRLTDSGPPDRFEQVSQLHRERSQERILLRRLDDARANRVVQDVSGDGKRIVFLSFLSKDSIEVSPLPELLFVLPPPGERGLLLEDSHEVPQVGIVCQAFDEQVSMVWHEAVRDYCEAAAARRSTKLRQDELHGGGIGEDSLPSRDADRQEIPMQTQVIEGLEPRCVLEWHTMRGAHDGPESGRRQAEQKRKADLKVRLAFTRVRCAKAC
jgi:hypothetical protein